jgi:hypothetical protein
MPFIKGNVMSKASRQTISLLAMVNAVFITIDSYGLAVELAPTIEYAKDICEKCIIKFPESGSSSKNMDWMHAKMKTAKPHFDKPNSPYSMIVLMVIAQHIVNDLQECINDPVKLNLIEPIAEVVFTVNGTIDPKGDQFEAYEEADKLLATLYHILEFSL